MQKRKKRTSDAVEILHRRSAYVVAGNDAEWNQSVLARSFDCAIGKSGYNDRPRLPFPLRVFDHLCQHARLGDGRSEQPLAVTVEASGGRCGTEDGNRV